jgi:hypothetical protein
MKPLIEKIYYITICYDPIFQILDRNEFEWFNYSSMIRINRNTNQTLMHELTIYANH